MNIQHVNFLSACINDVADEIARYDEYYTLPDTRPTNIQDRTINGFTGIHYATFYGSQRVFSYLIRFQYDFRTAAATTIQIRAEEAYDQRLSISRAIGQNPRDPGLHSPTLTSKSMMTLKLPANSTPLTIAVVTRNVEFFNTIVTFYNVQHPFVVQYGQENPLHMAAHVSGTGFAFAAPQLVECLSARNRQMETPLFIAARHSRYDILLVLQKLVYDCGKSTIVARVFTAFCLLCNNVSLSYAAFSQTNNQLFAIACDNMLVRANEFSKGYEDYRLEAALLEYERAIGRIGENAQMKSKMARLQGDGSVDWI